MGRGAEEVNLEVVEEASLGVGEVNLEIEEVAREIRGVDRGVGKVVLETEVDRGVGGVRPGIGEVDREAGGVLLGAGVEEVDRGVGIGGGAAEADPEVATVGVGAVLGASTEEVVVALEEEGIGGTRVPGEH